MNTGKQLLSCRVVGLLRSVRVCSVPNNSTTQQLSNSKRGGTLVEVMMAALVLVTLALAGGAYVSNSSATLAVHRDRSVAVAMANSRMEELRGMPFGSITSLVQTVGVKWLKRNGNGWTVTTTSNTTYDTFIIASVSEKMWTSIQFTNVVLAGDAVIMRVTATYRDPNSVVLQTIYAQ